ncbi:hypothetical protein [Streptomyces roseolus]|uniref:hypothetical protein n=1 Tax=Streptomyces roseolus TaxID=67358 RepID=UPI003665A7AF
MGRGATEPGNRHRRPAHPRRAGRRGPRRLRTGPAGARAAFGTLRADGLLVADGSHLVPADADRAPLAAVPAGTARWRDPGNPGLPLDFGGLP